MFLSMNVIVYLIILPAIIYGDVPYSGQQVRLVHGEYDNATSGIVQVYLRDRWGLICAYQWGIADANVVCKQLGFSSGAKTASIHDINGFEETDVLMSDVACSSDATDILDCNWSHPSGCQYKVSGVTCQENTGCPGGWIAGPSGCYIMPSGRVTNKDFAMKRCALRGGHLVNIESDAENNFLSVLFAGELNGPVLTGGVKVSERWLWEQVTNDGGTGDGDGTTLHLSTMYKPIEAFKWFPGWENSENGEPSALKRDRCTFLNNIFNHPNEGDIRVDYFFWEAKICKSTRKTLTSGFKYICERPRDGDHVEGNVGCYSYDGSDYRGNAAHTDEGTPCIKWTDAPDINPVTYPDMGLGDHNYCRNPDNDDKPWCWTSKEGEFGFCSIRRCTVNQNAVTTGQLKSGSGTDSCKADEFTCPDLSCIPTWWQCDLEPDCRNAEDEEGCDYFLHQFNKTERQTIRYDAREVYVGTTNESCARLCMSRENYVCRSFSFSRRTRECRLSAKNSLMVDTYPSRREDFYEVSFYLDDCVGMFKCNNGRCVVNDMICNGIDDCKDLTDEINCVDSKPIEVRLVGGSDSSGTVEVNYLGQWGIICDDGFDDKDAEVICRMMGYEGKATAVGGSHYGSGTGRFLLDELECSGNESSLEYCTHDGWTVHDCYSWEAAGVQCSLLDNLGVELVGGEENSGRVELVYDGIRGTICDNGWDKENADVVCRMLGYSYGTAHSEAYFGAGDNSLHILLENVDCNGDEVSIGDCAHSDWLKNDCTHIEDAGVTCFNGDNVETTIIAAESTTDQATSSTDTTTPTTSTESTTSEPTVLADIDCYIVAANYKGTISQTENGNVCQPWSRNKPHKHKYHDDKTFSDGSVSAAENYCRAPDDDSVPWCYTADRKVRWEYCEVPRCGGSGSGQKQNISCGTRPMMSGILRREVNDEFELLPNNDETEEDDGDDVPEIDTSLYRKMGRIYGGSVADYGMHPWQAGIRTMLSRKRRLHAHKCGATIIGEYWVLSAAHCFRGLRKERILIRTGDHHNRRMDEHEQEFEADKVIMHKGYNAFTFDYDIALIKLKPNNGHGIIFNDHVQPACLPLPNTKYEAGKKCLISGWGETADEDLSAYLKSARVPIVDDVTCNRLYKWSITENMVCAGYIAGGVDACAGDSGGPLVCDIDGIYTIMGITSFGEGCAVANAPGVYTKVSALLSWINDKMDANS